MRRNKRVLILCTANSARSQMGEGLLRAIGGGRIEVESAGARPTRVREEAIAVMGELGIDLGGHRSKSVDEFAGQEFDVVLTVCDNARDACPVFAGAKRVVHRAFADPAGQEGSWEERLAAFRVVRDEMAGYLRELARELEQ
ncbi:MAG: arsenate reductase ArsC [Acidobacteriota bacterium]